VQQTGERPAEGAVGRAEGSGRRQTQRQLLLSARSPTCGRQRRTEREVEALAGRRGARLGLHPAFKPPRHRSSRKAQMLLVSTRQGAAHSGALRHGHNVRKDSILV